MKKVLSMVLALALVLTALALPMSVSADTVDGKLAVSFDINDGSAAAINPGDTVKVDVVAIATEAYNLNYWSVDVVYDATYLTFVDPENANIVDLGGKVRIINEGDATPIATEGTDIATLHFTVKDTTPSSTTIQFTTNDIDTGFAQINGTTGNINSYDYTTTPASFTVAAHTFVAEIAGQELVENKTYYSEAPLAISVTADKATSVTLKQGEEEAVELTETEGVYTTSISATAAYTLTISMPGLTKIINFNYVAEDIEAELSLLFTPNADGYKAGDTFTADVILGGLVDAEAAMITFEMDIDKRLEITAVSEGLTNNEGTITYGTDNAEDGLPNGKVGTLTFTVNADSAYGDAEFNISDARIALVTSVVDPTDTEVITPTDVKIVTIVPATPEDYYTASGNDSYGKEAWSNVPYTYGVEAKADTINLKYIKSASSIESVDKAAFDGAEDLANGGINVDEATTYYLVANIDSVYKIVKVLANGEEVFFDAILPTITNPEAANMKEWKNVTTKIDLKGVTFADALSDVKETSYKYGTAGEFTPFTGTEIEVVAPENDVLETLTLKVVDKAGNEATADVTLMIDTVLPTVELTPGTQNNSQVVIDIVANDNKALGTVKAYYSPVALEAPVTTNAIEALQVVEVAESKITAGKDGVYYVVVADKATNKAYDFKTVTLATISEASDIKVDVVGDAAEFIAGFLNTTDMADMGILDKNSAVIESNGTFTQIAITVNAAAPGYENEVTLSNETGVVEYTLGEVLNTVGNYELKVKTYNTTDTSVSAEETYKFSIVAPADMISPNGDKRYNIFDFAMIKTLVLNGKNLPGATNEFVGGLFSGDMTGDLTMGATDYEALLQSLRAGEKPDPGYTKLPIMNLGEAAE